jgi:hypothetical protein
MSDSNSRNPGGFRPDPGDGARPAGGLSIDGALDELQRRRRRPAERRAAAPPPAETEQERHAEPEHQAAEQREPDEPELPSPLNGEAEQPQRGAFEDQAADGATEGEGEPEPREGGYTVVVDGQAQHVPVSELIAGYMRATDYTRKTQAATQVQQQFADAFEAFTKSREQLEQRLARFTAEGAREFEQPIDWVKLAQTDPMAWAEKRARYDELKAGEAEAQRLAGQRQAENYARQQEMVQRGQNVLVAAIPGWKEPAARTKLQTDMKEFAASVGYSPQELAADIVDPRQIIILHDAMMYRRMNSRRVTPRPPERQPTLERGGTAPAPQPTRRQQEAEHNFDQRPSVDNALAVIKARQARRTPTRH